MSTPLVMIAEDKPASNKARPESFWGWMPLLFDSLAFVGKVSWGSSAASQPAHLLYNLPQQLGYPRVLLHSGKSSPTQGEFVECFTRFRTEVLPVERSR